MIREDGLFCRLSCRCVGENNHLLKTRHVIWAGFSVNGVELKITESLLPVSLDKLEMCLKETETKYSDFIYYLKEKHFLKPKLTSP